MTRLGLALALALLSLMVLGTIAFSSSLAPAPTPPPTGPETAEQDPGWPVCFWSDQGPRCIERDVAPLAAAEANSSRALEALLEGPAASERAQGLQTAIPVSTTLAGLSIDAEGRVVVRLEVPADALDAIDHGRFEAIVNQIAKTLAPLEWRALHIKTRHPQTGTFVALADFLPDIPDPEKDRPPATERGELAPAESAYVGQPPAPGQGQPSGALSGKTVYVSAGHGWHWTGYAWKTQRPPYPYPPYEEPIIEDHNNAEAVNQYLLNYLWNAGAMVWPVRERDMNPAEVIVDNDAPGPVGGYTETGAWSTHGGGGYNGTDYRQTETVTGAPTATATWTATLPADGRYAVYVWYAYSNDPADARYTVHHAGGQTDVTVDQRHHGITWHYLGTYGFRGGEETRITLSNTSNAAGRTLIADAVRFGGGTFDDLSGIETTATAPPDKPWWEVSTFYYAQKMGMRQPPNDVVARPLYARWEHDDTGEDAVYVSWHTNGYSSDGYQTDTRGTMSIIHNGEGYPITPGSEALRDIIHDELVEDIRVGWDDPWWPEYKRSMNLGELRLLWDEDEPDNRIPGALIEIAYHDHPGDTDALKEPTFNMLAARAMYQGIVKYFAQRDGLDLSLLPEPPTHLAVENTGPGAVSVSWQAPATDDDDLVGDAATGYRVYTSTDGIGWSNAIVTQDTAYTLTDLAPGELIFVRVTATNTGGESLSTETLGARVGHTPHVLLVSGFDRLNNTMTLPEIDPQEGYNRRMWLDQMNRYDYVVQHGQVISRAFDSASNEAVKAGLVDLGNYEVVDWFLGEESAPDETLDFDERQLLESYLNGDNALLISGAEIGWHLDYLGGDRDFYSDTLHASYAGDDAESYQVSPVAGGAFEGLGDFRFDAAGTYDADYPDQLAPLGSAKEALTYVGGNGGTAAIQYANGCRRLIYMGFPFETIDAAARAEVMDRALGFLSLCVAPAVDTAILTPTDGTVTNQRPAFAGTAEAGPSTSVDRVEVTIQRQSDGGYWQEGTWGAESWLEASGTTSWSYSLPDPLEDDTYQLAARAWTTGGYSDTTPAPATFLYDTTAPTSTTLITPTGGVTITALPHAGLAWTAIDPGAGASIAYRVAVDEATHTTALTNFAAGGLADGSHTWGVQVFDAAGNESSWVESAFAVAHEHVWLPLTMRGHGASPPPPPPPTDCDELIADGGFETGMGWTLNQLASYETATVYAGSRSARVGIVPGGENQTVYSSVDQVVTLPDESQAELSMWTYPLVGGTGDGDYNYLVVKPANENRILWMDTWHADSPQWTERTVDLSEYAGQSIRIYVGAYNDGAGGTRALYIDDVSLQVCQ